MEISPVPENFLSTYRECFGEEWNLGPWNEATIFLQHNEGWALVEMIGDRAFIIAAGVYPHVRQKGVATESFKLAVDYLKENASDVQMVTKVNNIAPQLLALKNGFKFFGVITGNAGDMQIIWRLT
jgi:RimJ/RimL family protein N-acetyltransferase